MVIKDLKSIKEEYEKVKDNIFLDDKDRSNMMSSSKHLKNVKLEAKPQFKIIDFDGFMSDMYK